MSKILKGVECPKCGQIPFKCDVVKKYSNVKVRVKCRDCNREIIIDIEKEVGVKSNGT